MACATRSPCVSRAFSSLLRGAAGAVIAHGVRRFTTDVDAAIRGDAISIEALMTSLASQQIAARIPDAVAFAQENLVLLLRHTPTGVDLDVSFAWSAFEHEALAAATEVTFGRTRALMSTPADLVVLQDRLPHAARRAGRDRSSRSRAPRTLPR